MCTSHKLGVLYTHSLNLHHLMMKPHVTLVRFVILCVLFCVVNSIIRHCKKLVVRPFLWQMAILLAWMLAFADFEVYLFVVNYEDSTSIVPYGGQNWTQNWTKLFFFSLLRNMRETILQLICNCCFEAVAWVSWGPSCWSLTLGVHARQGLQ